jgi:hypothetical protein
MVCNFTFLNVAMKLFVKIILILIIAGNLAVYPNQACAAHYHYCLCCKKNICKCDVNFNGSDQSAGHNAPKSHCSFIHCDDCKQKRNTQETFLLAESSSELEKKIPLFVGHTTLINNTFVLGATTAISIFEQHLLSSFLRSECLRL